MTAPASPSLSGTAGVTPGAAGAVRAPHAPLTDYYADEVDQQRFLRQIFDATAPDYDRIERVLALGSGAWYRRRWLQQAGLAVGMGAADASGAVDVVDVGIGTGLVAREALAILGNSARLVGVDPSPGMLGEVDLPGIALRHGRAEALPCADASADFLSMGYALRHIGDVSAAFREFHRVLRPGGRLLVLEITKPQGRLATAALKAYMRAVVPMIAHVVGQQRDTAELWRYYWDTIEACIPPQAVLATLESAGFTDVRRDVELGIFSAYTARRCAGA